MNIEIRTPRDHSSDALRRHIERQIYLALRPLGRHIGEVAFTLRDINGPRGGPDKLGQVVVRLRRGAPLVVRATDASAYALASHLAATARRAVQSRIRRRRGPVIRGLRHRDRSEFFDNSARAPDAAALVVA